MPVDPTRVAIRASLITQRSLSGPAGPCSNRTTGMRDAPALIRHSAGRLPLPAVSTLDVSAGYRAGGAILFASVLHP